MSRSSALRHGVMLAVGGLVAAAVGTGIMSTQAQAVEVDLAATMHATATYPSARGHAEYESGHEGREFEMSLVGLRPLAGHRVVVRVHGDVVAKPLVGPRGRVHVDRHAGVPRMVAGNVVRVRTVSGTLVSSGTLHRELHD